MVLTMAPCCRSSTSSTSATSLCFFPLLALSLEVLGVRFTLRPLDRAQSSPPTFGGTGIAAGATGRWLMCLHYPHTSSAAQIYVNHAVDRALGALDHPRRQFLHDEDLDAAPDELAGFHKVPFYQGRDPAVASLSIKSSLSSHMSATIHSILPLLSCGSLPSVNRHPCSSTSVGAL
jgi:hypothetical protein